MMRYRNQSKVSSLIMFSYIRQTICSSLTSQHSAENVVALLHIAPIISGENENEAVCKPAEVIDPAPVMD